ncbi:PH domain-containing protein [Bacillus carboniphilus]|uniref:PH domain-containing protein n=1 Tax=Bacillus carboniphilus TaxID=86663 RepID=A0ABY9JSY1_9BACI|nr:PH domain-containing protein [Bacillus carboniphilus]WLR41373.1 PH domain-containing protein [Bacillus carboniphilus]
MFKKMAADALGLSDIGKIIDPADYDKTDADDYIFNEDQEKIYFLIKTKADEYCFTNLALIHVDGESAVSSKRTLKRYPYYQHKISGVILETAGRVDLDVEIKFILGNHAFDIDVRKDQIDQLKDLYKSLLKIEEIMEENQKLTQFGKKSYENAVSILHNSRTDQDELAETCENLTNYGFDWNRSIHEKYLKKDFGDVFEKYIYN